MFKLHDCKFWTNELVFMQGALEEQFERYCERWREVFIKHDASIANIYLSAIEANRTASKTISEALQQ